MNALLLFGALFLFILMGIPIAWSVALSSFTYILVNGLPLALVAAAFCILKKA